jgi:signal transduction histidine kinase
VRSLRARLVGWYLGVGVFIVAIGSLLFATVLLEERAYEARQAMAAAAAEVPSVVTSYRAKRRDLEGIDSFLRQHFRAQGVVVRVVSPARARNPLARLSRLDRPRLTSAFERLLAVQIKPVVTAFPGGKALIFVDPHSLAGTFDRLALFVALLAAVVLTASWRIAVVVAKNTLEPLVSTTAALSRFGSGAFTKVSVRDEDRGEPAELARAYNAAVDQTTQALAKRNQAEAEMRQFVADAGHQLRTPLTVITGYASGLLQRARSADERESYESMLAQARRMTSLIDRLVTLARLEHEDASPIGGFDANEMVACVRAGFDETTQRRIAVHPAPHAINVRAREADIREALCALVENSLKYAPGEVGIVVRSEGEACIITITDTGPGMAQADLERAYDRFYRGSNAAGTEGTGLGLSIVRKSVERSGGSVRLHNRPSGGLLAAISLKCDVVEVVADRDRFAVHDTHPGVLLGKEVANVASASGAIGVD